MPNYDDAMSYLNLTYRRKADIDYADPERGEGRCGRREGLEFQGDGNPQTNEAKKDKGSGGITMDSSGNFK